MKTLIDWLIGWPERVAQHLASLAPLFARIVVGWVFLWSGWGKLINLPAIIENFAGWHIPAPHILAPFVSGVEFFGGIFLLLGLLTRVSAGALGITMIVAIASAKWDQVDSLETLLGFDETEYLALFLWLAIAGAGRFSIDRLLHRALREKLKVKVALLARLEAKPGKETAVAQFLEGALPLANQESTTPVWFALRLGPSTFGIFDAFRDDAGRKAHLAGPIAAALMANATELLAQPPQIEQVDLLAVKLP